MKTYTKKQDSFNIELIENHTLHIISFGEYFINVNNISLIKIE